MLQGRPMHSWHPQLHQGLCPEPQPLLACTCMWTCPRVHLGACGKMLVSRQLRGLSSSAWQDHHALPACAQATLQLGSQRPRQLLPLGSPSLPPSLAPCSPLGSGQGQTHFLNRRLSVKVAAAGLPFALNRPPRYLKFKWGPRVLQTRPSDMQVEVDLLQEGQPEGLPHAEVEALLNTLETDAGRVVKLVLQAKSAREPKYSLPQIANLSLVVCDDPYIQQLNRETRGKDTATDVLSFELPDEGMVLPIKLLGDVVISLDTARRQAEERGHSLLDEVRILLVHGVLHLAGFDHERSEAELEEMAAAEQHILQAMGWSGSGLISAAGEDTHTTSMQDPPSASQASDDRTNTRTSSSSSGTSSSGGSTRSTATVEGPLREVSSSHRQPDAAAAQDAGPSTGQQRSSTATTKKRKRKGPGSSPHIQLVALDMDGTLLNGRSRIDKEVASVIKAACRSGLRVMLATGKARPAALAACREAGLEGDQLLVSPRTPGVFLQGLAVHGPSGQQLSDAALPAAVVEAAFRWSSEAGVSCVAFLGDECATLRMTSDLEELHMRYYEPLAEVMPELEQLLGGPRVRKLLFMAPPSQVEGLVKPHWQGQLAGSGAEVMQAVPNMLEVVPAGVNKWVGLQVLLDHMDLPPAALMAVGDGSNDLEMVSNAGLGIAMGNAVPLVKEAADVVVASNDEGGIVEAFERFLL